MKAVDSLWPVKRCQPTAPAVPTLSWLFVLNKLTLYCNIMCLEILFWPCSDCLNTGLCIGYE